MPVRREALGLYRLLRLGARTAQLWWRGRGLGRFDVVHANDLDTLPAAWLLARRRARLVYDAHELYTAFEADPPRVYGAAAGRLERVLAGRAGAVVTVNEPLAEELRTRLRLRRAPLVVLNAPEWDEREPAAAAHDRPLEAVYQGAFGPGRAFDDLLEALALAPNARLTVRVVHADPEALRREVARHGGLGERVVVADPVPPHEVVSGLRGFDVGLVFDRPVTRNTELSLPNKVFDYLMAGLAVVVPAMPALAALVEEGGVGVTFEPGRPGALAERLEELAADRERLAAMRARARTLARERYNAQRQTPVLAAAWGLADPAGGAETATGV